MDEKSSFLLEWESGECTESALCESLDLAHAYRSSADTSRGV
jgi:hypothetical protein